MLSELLKTIVGPRPVGVHTLGTEPLLIEDLPSGAKMCFSPALSGGSTQLVAGDEISAGQTIWSFPNDKAQPSPVNGVVASIGLAPNIRGGKAQTSVLIKARPGPAPTLTPLEANASTADILRRFRQAGVHTNEAMPRPLADALDVNPLDGLIIVALDREPEVYATIQLFHERKQDVPAAAELLRQVTGAREVHLAVPAPLANSISNISVLPIVPQYPESLDPLLKARLQVEGQVKTIALDTALAALDAVRKGQIQHSKVLTVITDGKAVGNYRVTLGTSFANILSQLGIELGPRDKLIAGGPMRGFAQPSANGAVDAGVDALVLIAQEDIIEWTQEPCINCGRCLDACPINLQVQLLGRYAEFGLFERTEELDVEKCIDCGLCASVCTARRPLLQLIRLSKREIDALPGAQ